MIYKAGCIVCMSNLTISPSNLMVHKNMYARSDSFILISETELSLLKINIKIKGCEYLNILLNKYLK